MNVPEGIAAQKSVGKFNNDYSNGEKCPHCRMRFPKSQIEAHKRKCQRTKPKGFVPVLRPSEWKRYQRRRKSSE